MNFGRITWTRFITIVGITFSVITWGLDISRLIVSNYRFFDRVVAPVAIISLIGAFICGIVLLKRNKKVGWSLVASAIAAFVFALLTPEL